MTTWPAAAPRRPTATPRPLRRHRPGGGSRPAARSCRRWGPFRPGDGRTARAARAAAARRRAGRSVDPAAQPARHRHDRRRRDHGAERGDACRVGVVGRRPPTDHQDGDGVDRRRRSDGQRDDEQDVAYLLATLPVVHQPPPDGQPDDSDDRRHTDDRQPPTDIVGPAHHHHRQEQRPADRGDGHCCDGGTADPRPATGHSARRHSPGSSAAVSVIGREARTPASTATPSTTTPIAPHAVGVT